MNANEYVVRIVKPQTRPALPNTDPFLNPKPKRANTFLKKAFNILAGSGVGFAAGMAIYLMLKTIGLNFGGLESSIIIGLPSILGIITSLAVY